MKKILNKELFTRIISVLVFIPLVILPIIYSKYISLAIFLIFISIITFEINEMKSNKRVYFNFYLFISILSFFLFLLLLVTEKIHALELLIVILIIWQFDTFSFLGGKAIGGYKLMPNISAGKTVSGLICGIMFTILFTELILNSFFSHYNKSIVFTLIIIFLSFVGDTIVSLLKRYSGIKDSGTIMPGHGGLLDRFDSFILVFFIIGLSNFII